MGQVLSLDVWKCLESSGQTLSCLAQGHAEIERDRGIHSVVYLLVGLSDPR